MRSGSVVGPALAEEMMMADDQSKSYSQADTGVMPNEIRDYLRRAPKKWSFDGARMVNHSYARLVWLASMAQGTLDEKINRRAGIAEAWRPWHFPVDSARRRHNRRQLIIKFGRPGNTHFPQ